MEYIVIAVILLVLAIAAICEHVTGNIPPWIWIVGGIIGMSMNVFGIGFCSWLESAISFVIMFVLILCTYSFLSSAIGGGILKLLWMCSIFWGRYTLIMLALLVIITLLCMVVREVFFKSYPSKMRFVPVLLVANIINFVLFTYIK